MRRFGHLREALPLLGEVAQRAEGVAGVGHGTGGKRQDAMPTILFYGLLLYTENPSVTYGNSSPFRGAKAKRRISPPRKNSA